MMSAVSALWMAVIVTVAGLALLLAAGALLLARDSDRERQALVRRIGRLSLRNKARLALSLVRDRRLPLAARAIPPALVLYLATPIDLIPDFIPVLGHLDDVLIVGLGIGLLLRFTPRAVLTGHVLRLEGRQHEPTGED